VFIIDSRVRGEAGPPSISLEDEVRCWLAVPLREGSEAKSPANVRGEEKDRSLDALELLSGVIAVLPISIS
jgi:hypothetical protein